MQLHIEGRGAPGARIPAAGNFAEHHNVHVAVQRRGRPQELLGLHSGDKATASWTLDCTITSTDTGFDVRGDYVQGPRGGRFIYLSWGDVEVDGSFTMFRRAKLMIDDIPADVLADATLSGRLVGRLSLLDHRGHPVCARVRDIAWSA